jgi:hypothetical protein
VIVAVTLLEAVSNRMTASATGSAMEANRPSGAMAM